MGARQTPSPCASVAASQSACRRLSHHRIPNVTSPSLHHWSLWAVTSGACLYSKDELLELRAHNRRQLAVDGEVNYFDAHASIATHEVALGGEDLLAYLRSAGRSSYLEGTMLVDRDDFSGTEDMFRVRIAWGSEQKAIYVINTTDGEAFLNDRNGTYYYNGSDALTW